MTHDHAATTLRTHTCGELRSEHIGQTVSLCGWVAKRREHGEKLAFVDLRDFSGVVQCVVDNDVDVRSEWVVRVTGIVRARPTGTENSSLATGQVEVGECRVEVLNTAEPPPFPIDARADDVDEGIRLRYRYLDIRRERMQRNLRVRARLTPPSGPPWRTKVSSKSKLPFSCHLHPRGQESFSCPRGKNRVRSSHCLNLLSCGSSC